MNIVTNVSVSVTETGLSLSVTNTEVVLNPSGIAVPSEPVVTVTEIPFADLLAPL